MEQNEQNGISKAYQRENIHFEIEKSISGYYRLVMVAKTKHNSINLIDEPASEDMYDYDVAVEIFNQFIDENFLSRTLNVINRAVDYNLFLPDFLPEFVPLVDGNVIENIICEAENIIYENVPIERKEYCKLHQSTQGQFYTWNDGEDDHTVSGDICHFDGYNIDGSKCTDGIIIYDLGIDKDAKVVGLYETLDDGTAKEEEKTDSDREERTIKVIGVGELTLSMWYNEKENKHIIDVFNENEDVLGQLVGVKPEDLYDDDIIIEKLKETEIVLARSLEDLILGNDIDGSYAMTLDGIIAVYKVLYNDDIEKMIDFINYVVENADEEIGQETLTWAKMFMVDKVFDETTEREFVEAVESGEFMNYICGDAFENFSNYGYDEWAWEVKTLIK